MTIGIATRGPDAGLAALRILQAVEALGSGAIGGFAVLHWRETDGRLAHAVTQDLGSLTLELPEGWHRARHAAIISSGPNRPEPLIQFVPGDSAAGFVTGHRLPTSLLPDGRVINQAALAAMAAGTLDQAGLEAMLAEGPAMDAGLICLPIEGPVLAANAPRVDSRDDIGRFVHDARGITCAILHNSIHAATLHGDALAQAAGAIGIETMGGPQAAHVLAFAPERLPVRAAPREAVEIEAQGRVIALHSADPAYRGGRPRITAIYESTPVIMQGRQVGRVMSEVFASLEPDCLLPGPRRAFVWVRDTD